VHVGFAVFTRLQSDEQETEQESEREEDLQYATPTISARRRDGDRDTEVSMISVFDRGTPKAGITSKLPSARGPSFPGPLVGQLAS